MQSDVNRELEEPQEPVIFGTSLKTHLRGYFDNSCTTPHWLRSSRCDNKRTVFELFPPSFRTSLCLQLVRDERKILITNMIVNTLFVVPDQFMSIFTIPRFVVFKPMVAAKLREEEIDFFPGGLV